MTLEFPVLVIAHLRTATEALSAAHHVAGEREGDRTDLNGSVRDLLFGLNTAIEALAALIEDAS